jgi:hypothetical protein
MEYEITGGCLCGAIRYEAPKPLNVMYCHCRMCQQAYGQPRVAGAYFKADEIRFTKGEAKRYRSSPHAYRGFCGTCGTPIYYHSTMPELRDFMSLMLGTFDQPERYPPTEHYNVETALPYCLHDDGLPRHYQKNSKYHWVRNSLKKEQE